MKLFGIFMIGVSSMTMNNVFVANMMEQAQHKKQRLAAILTDEIDEATLLLEPVIEIYNEKSMKVLHEKAAASNEFVNKAKDSTRYSELVEKKEKVTNLMADVREQCLNGGVTSPDFDPYDFKQLPELRECVRRLKEQYDLHSKKSINPM